MNLEWNVLYYDFNSDKVKSFNIFNSRFIEEIKNIPINDKETLKGYIDRWAKYNYWSRAEYEIIVSGLFEKCNQSKIDVYTQIKMNLDRITDYVFDYLYNKGAENE